MGGFDELTFNLICSRFNLNRNELTLLYESFSKLSDVDLSVRFSGNRFEFMGEYKGYDRFISWKDAAYKQIKTWFRESPHCEISFTPRELRQCFEYRDLLSKLPENLPEELLDIPCLYQRHVIDSKTKSPINISFTYFPKPQS